MSKNNNDFEVTNPKSLSELESELEALLKEEKELDLEIKRAQVERIKTERRQKLEEARIKILATQQMLAQRKLAQESCNHRKGGDGAEALTRGKGTDSMYAIVRHMLPTGRIFILCTRCGKEWHPGDPIKGTPPTPGYDEALQFPTNNSMSGSSLFFFEKSSQTA